MKKRSIDSFLNRKRRATDKEYKKGDIVTDVKMETNFFIISDDENNADSDTTTLIADVKPSQQTPSLVGTSLLVTKKGKTGQRYSQIIGNGKTENYLNSKYQNFKMKEKKHLSSIINLILNLNCT